MFPDMQQERAGHTSPSSTPVTSQDSCFPERGTATSGYLKKKKKKKEKKKLKTLEECEEGRCPCSICSTKPK